MRTIFRIKRQFLTAAMLIALCLVSVAATMNSGQAQRAGFESPYLASADSIQPLNNPPVLNESRPTDCVMKPELSRQARVSRSPLGQSDSPITLLRFRQLNVPGMVAGATSPTAPQPGMGATPRERIVLIDPTNFGDRYYLDVNNNVALLPPIVVLHETVASATSTLNFFRTPHPNDDDQASYHTLIQRDGTIVYMVPPDKRAYGAGNSVFQGKNGPETVKTHPQFPSSVNNFAYHVSLESPPDGYNNGYRHSGYTEAQYNALAWLVAKTGVPDDRITTHQAVDRSGSRLDPRSFSRAKFLQQLQLYPRTTEIVIGCTVPSGDRQLDRTQRTPPKPAPTKPAPAKPASA